MIKLSCRSLLIDYNSNNFLVEEASFFYTPICAEDFTSYILAKRPSIFLTHLFLLNISFILYFSSSPFSISESYDYEKASFIITYLFKIGWTSCFEEWIDSAMGEVQKLLKSVLALKYLVILDCFTFLLNIKGFYVIFLGSGWGSYPKRML